MRGDFVYGVHLTAILRHIPVVHSPSPARHRAHRASELSHI